MFADEFDETDEPVFFDVVLCGRDAYEDKGDEGGEYLILDGVFGTPEEISDLEMLLNPPEEEFDLPALEAEGSALMSCSFKITGDPFDPFAIIAAQADTPHGKAEPNAPLATSVVVDAMIAGEPGTAI